VPAEMVGLKNQILGSVCYDSLIVCFAYWCSWSSAVCI